MKLSLTNVIISCNLKDFRETDVINDNNRIGGRDLSNVYRKRGGRGGKVDSYKYYNYNFQWKRGINITPYNNIAIVCFMNSMFFIKI